MPADGIRVVDASALQRLRAAKDWVALRNSVHQLVMSMREDKAAEALVVFAPDRSSEGYLSEVADLQTLFVDGVNIASGGRLRLFEDNSTTPIVDLDALNSAPRISLDLGAEFGDDDLALARKCVSSQTE